MKRLPVLSCQQDVTVTSQNTTDTSKIGMYQSLMVLDDLWNYLEVKEATLAMHKVQGPRNTHQFWAL